MTTFNCLVRVLCTSVLFFAKVSFTNPILDTLMYFCFKKMFYKKKQNQNKRIKTKQLKKNTLVNISNGR